MVENGRSVQFALRRRPVYPFTAIVGQEEMKLALLLNVIDPKIGGVMIMAIGARASPRRSGPWPICCRKLRWWQTIPSTVTPMILN